MTFFGCDFCSFSSGRCLSFLVLFCAALCTRLRFLFVFCLNAFFRGLALSKFVFWRFLVEVCPQGMSRLSLEASTLSSAGLFATFKSNDEIWEVACLITLLFAVVLSRRQKQESIFDPFSRPHHLLLCYIL